jgi:APA family basic amino acid/polyamine antiporter
MTTDSVRPFGFWTAMALVVGGVIGAGIYVVPGQFAGLGWTGAAAWLLGGAGALLIGRVLTALIAARPDEPGVIAVIGDVLGPIPGVLVGWGAWVSYWCANAYIALTAARYAGALVPGLAATTLRQTITACLAIVALSVLNLSGLKGAGRFQVATTALKLLPLLAVMLILGGMALGSGSAAHPVIVAHEPFSLGALLPATTLAMVAIIGFESASIAAERIRDPERNVGRSTMAGIAMACVLYLIVCTGITFTVPADRLAGSTAPVALFIADYWGPWAGAAVAAFAVISSIGCLNVWIMLQGEVPLGLVRAGLLPGWLARTNHRDIASAPLVIASSLSCVLLLLANWRGGAQIMDFMLKLTAVSGTWIYVFAALAALRLRLAPALATLALVFALAIIAGGGFEAAWLGAVLMLTALPLYALAVRGERGIVA